MSSKRHTPDGQRISPKLKVKSSTSSYRLKSSTPSYRLKSASYSLSFALHLLSIAKADENDDDDDDEGNDDDDVDDNDE